VGVPAWDWNKEGGRKRGSMKTGNVCPGISGKTGEEERKYPGERKCGIVGGYGAKKVWKESSTKVRRKRHKIGGVRIKTYY